MSEEKPKLWTFVVAQSERGWDVWDYDSTGENISPKCSYPNAYKAAARLLQLMDIKLPVTPQDWPERICIGEIPDDQEPGA